MSDANARPAGFTGFVLREKYSRITCDEPGYEGLWAEVRTNLSHAEREAFLIARDELDQGARDAFRVSAARAVALDAAVAEAGDDERKRTKAIKDRESFLSDQIRAGQTLRVKRFALVAPYIRAWNVCTDDYRDAPAPAVDATGAFEWIDDVISIWLFTTCEDGYKGGPKGVRPSRLSGDVPALMSGQQSEIDAG